MGGKCQLITILFLPLCTFYIFLIFSTHITLSASQALKSFGEACDADCNEGQLLTCSQNTSVCECMHPTSMVYDQEEKKCVGKAGFTCVRYASDFLCVNHAYCDKVSKTCSCDKGYFAGENGTTCSRLAKYGDACSAKRPCDQGSGMACMEKTSGGNTRAKRACRCMYPEDQFYDPSQNACISYAGGNCSFSLPCVRNAECAVDIYEQRVGENIHGRPYSYNVTVGKKCACKEGTTQTKSRQCLRTYHQPCDPEANRGDGGCNTEENLKCFDSSVCLCTNPLSQIYDKAVGKCVNLVGAKCISRRRTIRRKEMEKAGDQDDAAQADKSADDATTGEILCSSNAQCISSSGICDCKDGYSSSPFSTCLKDYGTECGSIDTVPCNFYRGLSCHHTSGTCGCIDEDNLKYDSDSKTCLSVEIGGPCGTFEYSDRVGFVLGREKGELMMVMMGNHNKEIMVSRNNISIGSGNDHIHYGGSSQGITTMQKENSFPSHFSVQTFSTTIKIQIRCNDELECVNLFGETVIMDNGRISNHNNLINNMYQGFCRKRN